MHLHCLQVRCCMPDREARPRCLTSLTKEAARAKATHLLIERDDSIMQIDRSLIAGVLRKEQATELIYRHVAPHEHPLLWISDAVAWCYSRGGDWIRRAEPLVEARVLRP